MNKYKIVVLEILGDTVDGLLRVFIESICFQAINQSSFARMNKETPLLLHTTHQDSDGNWYREFIIDNVMIRRYRAKGSEGVEQTYFLMFEQDAKNALDPTAQERVKTGISAFDLSIQPKGLPVLETTETPTQTA